MSNEATADELIRIMAERLRKQMENPANFSTVIDDAGISHGIFKYTASVKEEEP